MVVLRKKLKLNIVLHETGAHHADESQGSYERRPRVAERAEEARGGHYRKVDQ